MPDRTVIFTGPLFDGDTGEILKGAVQAEAVAKVLQRWQRSPKKKAGAGVRNNFVAVDQLDELTGSAESTRNWPRTKGTSWVNYNLKAATAVLRNALPKIARKLAEGLNG